MSIFTAALATGLLLVLLYRVLAAPGRIDGWAGDDFVAAAYGLAPREELDSRRAGPPPPAYRTKERDAVAHAVWEGDWKVAEEYLRAAGEDWDERWSRMELLQQVAGEDDTWLAAWCAESPGDCDAATLHANLTVHRAWDIRGSGYADEILTSVMDRFRVMLTAAIEEARQAALLDPANPGPWVVMVTAARGAGYRRAQFAPLWEGLVARAPHHYEGHWQALQYWCAKWFGSNRRMMRFARRTLRKAPPGSPLAGIYLHALDELDGRSGGGIPDVTLPTRSALKRIAASFDQVTPDNERLPVLRHLLAYHMLRSKLYAPALEQFRLLGPWCGAQPWRAKGNAVLAFEAARGTAATLSRVRPTSAAQTQGAVR
ncbi:hypothetical protein [Streptomyces sp. NPDC055055]